MNAIEIFAWFANEQIRVFTPAPKPPQEWCDANLLLRWFANFVRTHNQLCIQKNHLLKQGPRATRSSARLNAALLLLWQQGILQEQRSGRIKGHIPFSCTRMRFSHTKSLSSSTRTSLFQVKR